MKVVNETTIFEGERRVNFIPTKVNLPNMIPGQKYQKKRVAAYARVSTDEDEQLSSYEAQVDFYTRHIKSKAEWEFAGIYADEGISGTNTKKREEFNRMVNDALAGHIDLILTKSVSRFARNTVDSLITVRKLKEKGVEVYFEKENIYTLDARGELLITIMSSLAQEESRSISENVTWGIRRGMEDGKIYMGYKHFLGYDKGDNGLPQIVQAEAEIVRKIYALFLEGQTYRSIAKYLMEQAIPTPGGKTKWNVSTVQSILSNEKYKGDALLQKTYTTDFLSKTVKKNEGELPQYYIENSHPAIIDPETFDLVQSELKKRRPNRHRLNNNSPFSAKIICGQCGGFYGSKVWHSADQYRSCLWQCNHKYKDTTFCDTPHIREKELKQAFVEAFNRLLGDKAYYLKQMEDLLPLLADTATLTAKQGKLIAKRGKIEKQLRCCIEENTKTVQDQTEYERRFLELTEQFKALDRQVAAAEDEILECTARKERIRRFLDELKDIGEIVDEFDENLWHATVDNLTVHTDSKIAVMFRDGTEISVDMPIGKK